MTRRTLVDQSLLPGGDTGLGGDRLFEFEHGGALLGLDRVLVAVGGLDRYGDRRHAGVGGVGVEQREMMSDVVENRLN